LAWPARKKDAEAQWHHGGMAYSMVSDRVVAPTTFFALGAEERAINR